MLEHQRSYGRFLPTYATLVGLPALALFVILRIGNAVAARGAATNAAEASPSAIPAPHPASTPAFDLPLLLIQIIVILVAARLIAALGRRLGQPQVVGEMLAGIALGASILGAQARKVAAPFFPAASLARRPVTAG